MLFLTTYGKTVVKRTNGQPPRLDERPNYFLSGSQMDDQMNADQPPHDQNTCPSCSQWPMWDRIILAEDNPYKRANLSDYYIKKWKAECPKFAKPPKVGNGTPNGIFAGTLTMSPDWGKTEEDICTAVKKILTQQTCPVKRYRWYLEYTKANVPHIHFIYETNTGGRIHTKVFKRYWTWEEPRNNRSRNGFRGGYHYHCDSTTAYLEYIAKDGNTKHEDKWT